MAATSNTKGPRVPPSPNSMAARAAAARENTACRTQVAKAMSAYARSNELFVELDTTTSKRELIDGKAHATMAAWRSVKALAEMAMHQPPQTIADVSLTIGLAASWIGTVYDALPEGDAADPTVLAITSALENATLLLGRDIPRDQFSPGIAVLVDELIEQAERNGAEIVDIAA